MEHFNKEFNNQFNNWKVWTDDGYVATRWQEGDDIRNYSSFKVAYCPVNMYFDKFRVLTDAEDSVFQEQRRKALENI